MDNINKGLLSLYKIWIVGTNYVHLNYLCKFEHFMTLTP